MKKHCMMALAGLTLSLLLSTTALAGKLSATVNRTEIANNESLALDISLQGDSSARLDTRELEQNFIILNRNESSSISIINGSASSSTTWHFELMPRKVGNLLIPSFNINGEFSEAIAIKVTPAPKNPVQERQNIFTETELLDKKIYVQQQAIIAWRLVSRLNISDLQFQPPQIDGVLVQDLGNRSYQRASDDGVIEQVIEQRYALFPQQSGNIAIPPQQFMVSVNSTRRSSMGIMHPGRSQVRMRTEAQTLEVLPADNTQQAVWLPATAVDITQEIITDDGGQQPVAGTAFTRVIRISAEGLSAEQLPPVDMQAAGIRSYPEKPVFNNSSTEAGVIGLREDRAAVIANQPGTLELPGIDIPWYDVKASQWRRATLPATTLEILPASNMTPSDKVAATSQPTTADTAQGTAPGNATNSNGTSTHASASGWAVTYGWQILAGLLSLLWLGTLAYLIHIKRQGIQHPAQAGKILHPDKTAHSTKQLRQAAQQADIKAFYSELLNWSAGQLSRRQALQHPSISPLVLALEKHLYGNGPAPQAEALRALPDQLESIMANAHDASPAQLRPLYP